MIDLAQVARKHGLPLAVNGRSIPLGNNGRLVAWLDGLAYTSDVRDAAAERIERGRLGRTMFRNASALTVAFPLSRLSAVVRLVQESGALAA